jgi:predicted lipoprotein with Yx(FWY)xxD motif
MKHPLLLIASPILTAIAIAGCGGSSTHPSHAAAPQPHPAPTGSATKVTLAHSALGSYLADGRGRALYLFEADKGTQSTCYSACASIWPPFTTTGAVKPGSGVIAALLGTSRRTDGTTEVTYKGHPLYYYAGDSGPAQTTGQGLNQFGAKWYLLAANGNKIAGNRG